VTVKTNAVFLDVMLCIPTKMYGFFRRTYSLLHSEDCNMLTLSSLFKYKVGKVLPGAWRDIP
jgi:hypothetical protein